MNSWFDARLLVHSMRTGKVTAQQSHMLGWTNTIHVKHPIVRFGGLWNKTIRSCEIRHGGNEMKKSGYLLFLMPWILYSSSLSVLGLCDRFVFWFVWQLSLLRLPGNCLSDAEICSMFYHWFSVWNYQNLAAFWSLVSSLTVSDCVVHNISFCLRTILQDYVVQQSSKFLGEIYVHCLCLIWYPFDLMQKITNPALVLRFWVYINASVMLSLVSITMWYLSC